MSAEQWSAKPMPPLHKELLIEGSYTSEEVSNIRRGYLPRSSEDVWVIFPHAGWIYFNRRRTGTCIYKLKLTKEGEHYAAERIIVNRDPQQYRSEDDEYDVSMVGYLVDTLLLGRFAPLPTPKGLRQEDLDQYKKDVTGNDKEGGINLTLLS